ncbi:MAG: metallophosphoesterase family protein, partial [Candidatus Poribacteria bacterium]
WYAFVYGNSIFIILDANLMTHEEEFYIPQKRVQRQYYWLKKVLKSASKDAQIKHKFIFFHEAPFVSAQKKVFGLVTYHLGHAKKLRTYKIDDDFFLDIFREYDVDAVFVGHVHYYERWVERYRKDGEKRKITWVTTGGGGAINEIKWRNFTLGMRPPMVLTKKEKRERVRPYNRRAKRAKDIVNWSLAQGYPTRKSESIRALEKHYCIVHVDGDSVWMEVKNSNRDLIENVIIR